MLKKSKKIGLFDELNLFYDLWFKSNGLVIYYEDLIKYPTKTINEVAKYFDLPHLNNKIELKKERYSRYPFWIYKYRKYKKIFVKILDYLGLKNFMKMLR
jgi:hypothetical protein